MSPDATYVLQEARGKQAALKKAEEEAASEQDTHTQLEQEHSR